MAGNDGTGNIEARDNWQTPDWLFDCLNVKNNFNFDCCAEKKNSKCKYWSEDFLDEKQNLDECTCWMNPPFSKALHMFDKFFKIAKRGVCIYRCDNMETKIWQDIILKHATWIFIPKGRISYEGKVGKGSRFPSALIGFNVKPPKDIEGATLSVQIASQEKKK